VSGSPSRNYELRRQDDHGHRFLVGRFATLAEAERRLAELTRCQHKQTYWIAETGSHTEHSEPT
jgi:hypothetical protein